MDDITKKIFDSRSPYKAGLNYKISKHNEEVAMEGLVTCIGIDSMIQQVFSEKIESDEEWLDGKMHVKPDFFLDVMKVTGDKKRWTVEVKTTCYDSFLNEEIIIKAPQVWTCKNNHEKYPRPYILAATDKEFTLIPMGSFWNSQPDDIKFGEVTKKGYLLKCSDYKWTPFVSPLIFKKYGNYTNKSTFKY